MDTRPVYRCHARGLLLEPPESGGVVSALRKCQADIQDRMDAGDLMTAALFHYGRQVFLYYEAIGTEMEPEAFMEPLSPLLADFPQKEETCKWAKMYHVFWHDEPRSADDWKRNNPESRQRGRIAYLRHETMFEYVYHHFALTQEGLHRGDRYMSIALHEDVLFSYFEEPRSSVNIRRTDEGESEALKAWMDTDPDSHFIHLPGSEGQNFLLLPSLLAMKNTRL